MLFFPRAPNDNLKVVRFILNAVLIKAPKQQTKLFGRERTPIPQISYEAFNIEFSVFMREGDKRVDRSTLSCIFDKPAPISIHPFARFHGAKGATFFVCRSNSETIDAFGPN